MKRRALAIAVLGTLVALGWQAPAAAHNSLIEADPDDGATMEQGPDEVSLRFLSTLEEGGAVITVTGPDGADAADGAPEFDGASVSIPVQTDLPGAYTIAYEVASADGHQVSGTVEFTVTVGNPPPSPSPTAELSPTPAAPTSATPAAQPASPSPAADEESGSLAWWPLLVAGVVVLVGAVSSVELIRRRRSR